MSKIASLTTRASQPPAPAQVPDTPEAASEAPAGSLADDPSLLLADLLDPNALDFSWEAMWDTPSGIMNFSL